MDSHDGADGGAEKIEKLLDAALPLAAFDGWNDSVFAAAAEAARIGLADARFICPNKGLDLAIAFHRRGDDHMAERLRSEDLPQMRFRDRVAWAVRIRLSVMEDHRDAVRRAASLFAMPMNSHHGARAIWRTADRIWDCLGDTSDDINWYSKRALLAGVYSASFLYWLGDSSAGSEATRDFVDRRINDVMRIEGLKVQARTSPVFSVIMRRIDALGRAVRRPPDRNAYPGGSGYGEN